MEKENLQADLLKDTSSIESLESNKSLRDQIILEINLMAKFAFRKGKTVNVKMEGYEENNNIDELAAIHSSLSQIVAPATPRTIFYLERLKHSAKSKQKAFMHPLIYQQLMMGIIALIIFLVTSVTTYVNKKTLSEGIDTLNGIAPFVTLIFLSSLAILGVIFSTFKSITDAVKNGSVSEEDSSYYLVLMIIGIISGVIFSKAFQFNLTEVSYSGVKIDNILFSFLGGFSAETLREIILSLMNKIKGIFKVTNTDQSITKNN